MDISIISVCGATESQQNMADRADYMYNSTWVCQKDVAGWRSQSTFYKGSTYRVPYGQPIYSGKYIGFDCFGASEATYKSATADASSVFYTARSNYDDYYSTYYANDCSAFVSYCWGHSRCTTATIPSISTKIGAVTTSNVKNYLQLGDALNTVGSHVVIVSDITYDSSGQTSSIVITEQTPPQLKRTTHTVSELVSKYSAYTIYRYTGTVPPAPDEVESTTPTTTFGKYYPACSSSATSLVTALSSVGISDTSIDYRTKIAEANGITNYVGSAEQNTEMLNLLKAGQLINPDYVEPTETTGTTEATATTDVSGEDNTDPSASESEPATEDDTVVVTLKSQQGLFDEVTKTYKKGDTFEMTVLWQSDDLLRNGEFYTYLNNKGLFVTAEELNSKISGEITNITEDCQKKYGEVSINFSVVNGMNYNTTDTIVKYQIKVLDTASAEETLTLYCREAKGVPESNLAEDIFYCAKGIVNESNRDAYTLSATLSDVCEITTATEDATQATQVTESTIQTEATEPTESTVPTKATEPTESTVPTEATEPTESTVSTEATEPTESTVSTEVPESTESKVSTEDSEPTDITVPTETVKPVHTHQWGEGFVTKEAGCTVEGELTYSCSGCDETKTTPIQVTGHNYDEGTVLKDATCTEDGVKLCICLVCENSKAVTISATGHTASDNCVVSKQATCTEDGEITNSCIICSEILLTQNISATAHTEVADKEVAPTCTETGLTAGSHCSICNEVLTAQQIVGALGHTEVIDKAENASCTTTGLTEGKHCAVCGEVTVKQTVIDATGHLTEIINKKNATYFAKGYTGDTVCSTCGQVISKGVAIKKLVLKTPAVKITGGKKKITVKYTKIKGATGFQVKYKVGKKQVTKTYATKKSATKVINKLKKGTYKVQVRAFVKNGSKKVYSKWTGIKKVKVKK